MKEALLLAAMRCQQGSEDGVITITGTQGSGKSLLAMKAALLGMKDHNVLYVSDELHDDLVREKMGIIYDSMPEITAGTVHTEYVPHSTDVLVATANKIATLESDMVVLDLVTTANVREFALGLVASGKTVVMTKTAKRKV